MVKLVDTLDLGSSALRRGGSSPSTRTIMSVKCYGSTSVSKTESRGSTPCTDANLGIAQPGSALVLGTSGRWFESSYRDHIAAFLLGEDSAFQADGIGSNPVCRSNYGRLAEWSIATVLKTVEPTGSVSSNLTPSAIK